MLETINSSKPLLVHKGSHGAAAVTHLTFGSNAYVSVDRCLRPQVDGLLDADISEGVFSKDRTSIKVGSHEAAEARQSLVCKTKKKGVENRVQQHSVDGLDLIWWAC